MALRTKTIEYAFPAHEATTVSTTRVDLSAITLYVPEVNSRTFRSVFVQVSARDSQSATGGRTSLTDILIGVKLGSAAFDDFTLTSTIGDTAEQLSCVWHRDATSYFNTNFGSGTSQTCQVGFTFTGTTFINVCVKLIITYEYDDSAQSTRIKTVRIPLESPDATLSTTLTSIGGSGTDHVPALDTFLPEASKTYRNIFFEVMTNETSIATTDFALNLALDSEAADPSGTLEQACQSSPWFKYNWIRNDMATDVAHDFKASSTVANRFGTLVVILVVTYEYDHSSSTRIMNSVMLPIGHEESNSGGDTSDDASRLQRPFLVQEPGTITMKQSGCLVSFADSNNISGLNIKIGDQAYRAWNHDAGSVTTGMFTLIQRVDSGSSQGAAFTLARGENQITFDWYRTDGSNMMSTVSVVLYMNYESDKHADGDGAHVHSTLWLMQQSRDTSTRYSTLENDFGFNIPETNYWVSSVGFQSWQMQNDSNVNYTLMTELQAGEREGDGWFYLGSVMVNTNSERFLTSITFQSRPAFNRYARDPDPDRLDVETARTYRFHGGSGFHIMGVIGILTYHSMTKSVSGTVSGYTGDGSGITVEVFQASNSQKVDETTTVAGGTFSLPVYDDTIEYYVTARQDSTHIGRSDNGTPS